MQILIASDSFKGSCSSLETGKNIEKGFKKVFSDAVFRVLPIADGGEGTVEALLAGIGGEERREMVTGPLGERREAAYGMLKNGTAVIEMATASGLPLVPPEKRDPRVTTTYGTGELIRKALDAGAKKIFIGIGGSATNDGGAGMAQALGARFLDADGRELGFGGLELARLAAIDVAGLDPRLKTVEVIVACDVTNPLCGELGASYVYGPQKGASPEAVRALDAALRVYGEKLNALCGRDIAAMAGAGAAGGLGAGLVAFCGGVLKPGIEEVMAIMDIENAVREADLVITGEGRVDRTSAFGKVFSGLGKTAARYGKPVIGFCGGIGNGYEAVYDIGVCAVMATPSGPMTLAEAMADAPSLITDAAERAARLIRIGTELG